MIPCHHAWMPTPADALSARTLVGHTRCLRCGRTATLEDMAALGRTMVTEDRQGRVEGDYDVMGGR